MNQSPAWHGTRVDIKTKERPCGRCGIVMPMLASRKYCPTCSKIVQGENAKRAWAKGLLKRKVPKQEKKCRVCSNTFLGFSFSVYCSKACRTEHYNKIGAEFARTPDGLAKARRALLKKNYGITLEQKQSMIDNQGGQCPICHSALEVFAHSHVDHNHQTGKVRAVLCRFCNVGLGAFKENMTSLSRAIDYLREHENINR